MATRIVQRAQRPAKRRFANALDSALGVSAARFYRERTVITHHPEHT
jgi:hypothetical protein